jgi:hypothetical protein
VWDESGRRMVRTLASFYSGGVARRGVRGDGNGSRRWATIEALVMGRGRGETPVEGGEEEETAWHLNSICGRRPEDAAARRRPLAAVAIVNWFSWRRKVT